jgi:hypothetical protein
MVKYDFPEWLKSLEDRSSAELLREGIRACGEAILGLSSNESREHASDFARRVGQFLFWVKNRGTVKPENVSPEDWQAYASIARSLVAREDFNDDILKFWTTPAADPE